MKVLQINTIYKFRNTGRICWEVEKALEADGDSCLIVHQVGELCDKKHSLVVNTKLGYYFYKLMSRLLELKMFLDLYKQVTDTAGKYLVNNVENAMMLNIGGSATTNYVYIVGRS